MQYKKGNMIGKWNWYSIDSTVSEHFTFTGTECLYETYTPSPGIVPNLNKRQAVFYIQYETWHYDEGLLKLQNNVENRIYRCIIGYDINW
jgi:hypothetical protein